jgi:hypothetical protein
MPPVLFHSVLFHPDHHRIWPVEMFDARLFEAGLAHPGGALRTRVPEPAARLDQHIQAHQQPKGVGPALVVDDGVEDDERPVRRQSVVGLAEQHLLAGQVPVTQEMAQDDNVRAGKRLSEKVERRKPEPVPQSVGRDVVLEDRSDDRQVGADARQVSN